MNATDLTSPLSELHLIQDTSETNCKFWCGASAVGSLEVKSLLEGNDIDLALHDAAKIGIKDEPPLLVSENTKDSQYFLYFFHFNGQETILRSLDHLESFLKGQELKSLGLYISSTACDDPSGLTKVFKQMIQHFVQHLGLSKIFILSDTADYQNTLNSLLKVKRELDAEKISLLVYH